MQSPRALKTVFGLALLCTVGAMLLLLVEPRGSASFFISIFTLIIAIVFLLMVIFVIRFVVKGPGRSTKVKHKGR